MTRSDETLQSKSSSLVQATISTLLKKVEEKAEDEDIEEFSSTLQDTNGSNENCDASDSEHHSGKHGRA
ncbi:hypothetical protein SLE2022_347500 [Rubroshorea leprosula]